MYRLRFVCLVCFVASLTVAQSAAGRTTIEGFTKAPTFTPPDGCIPTEHVYGVVAACKKLLTEGRYFTVFVDTFAGSGGSPQEFLDDQIIEIKQWWTQNERGTTFSSNASPVIPGNAPPGIVCAEYSVTAATDDEVKHVEGITCTWPVEHRGWKIEICVLEANDTYRLALGQKPMPSFDGIVRALFLSMRL